MADEKTEKPKKVKAGTPNRGERGENVPRGSREPRKDGDRQGRGLRDK